LNFKTQGRQIIIVDGKLLLVARVRRALTQRIRFWRKELGGGSESYTINIKKQQVLVDEEGKVVDIWLKPALTNETRALKEKLRFRKYLREIVEGNELIGDKGYRGVKGLKIVESKEEKRKNQVVEVFFAKL